MQQEVCYSYFELSEQEVLNSAVYSGIVNPGNGNGDPSNKESTFGRGLQFVNADGVVQFQTFYPGHYAGRAHHIHVATHLSGT
jgi:protocatechuate 3,4-dioxygenase beta subunit